MACSASRPTSASVRFTSIDDEHDAFEAALRLQASPLQLEARRKAMRRAMRSPARPAAPHAAPRAPLASLLNAAIQRFSPDKLARRATRRAMSVNGAHSAKAGAPASCEDVPAARATPPAAAGTPGPRVAVSGGVRLPAPTLRHVRSLYTLHAAMAREREAERAQQRALALSSGALASPSRLRQRPASAAASAPSPAALAGLLGTQLSRFPRVLRAHYPRASTAELGSMLAAVAPEMEAAERQRWVAAAKATQGDRLAAAFHDADGDGNGGLSADEFAAAVAEAQEARASTAAATGAPPPAVLSPAALRAVFAAADADGNGLLDLDEFLALCAAQPAIVGAFDAIVECGLRRAAARDAARGLNIFRTALSPRSRCIRSPCGGTRYQPALCHLRPMADLMRQHASSTNW